MTYKEKFELEHPKMDPGDLSMFYSDFCPDSIYDAKDPDYCIGSNECGQCTNCWGREIPEFNSQSEFNEQPLTSEERQTLNNMQAEHCTIKDSGDRTQFETGAVRDMREGKGRCDLMPLEVVRDLMTNPRAKEIMDCINNFKFTNDTEYLVHVLIEFAATYPRDSLLASICTMFLEVAKHFEDGAKKYGENNWQKGIPVHCYIDSAIRHYLKHLRGDTDEPHDRAFVWNIMCCIWEVDCREKKESK